jgi:hypothetical protein
MRVLYLTDNRITRRGKVEGEKAPLQVVHISQCCVHVRCNKYDVDAPVQQSSGVGPEPVRSATLRSPDEIIIWEPMPLPKILQELIKPETVVAVGNEKRRRQR